MARPRRLFWLLFLPLVATVAVSAGTASWYAAAHLRRFTIDEEVADLESAAHLAVFRLAERVPGDQQALGRICREMGLRSVRRITLVLPSWEVLCDSEVDRDRFERPAELPEFTAAFAGRIGHAVRFSRTLDRSYIYVAVPLHRGKAVAAALRVGLPFDSVEERLGAIRRQLLAAAAVIVLFGSAGSFLIARWLARPIERLRRSVDRFAAGDLQAPILVSHTVEVTALGNALQAMAGQLDSRIAAIEEQRRLQGAILGAMTEGVFAVDSAGLLLLVNSAAVRMLGAEAAAGTPLRQVPGAGPLLGFVAAALKADAPLEEVATAGSDGALFLHLHGAPLHDRTGARFGALVVLNDVSRLQSLERARRDFVTNVAHELKTPVTTITGYVELLLDGAIDDPPAAEHFLENLRRQATRLGVIIDDLLVLARLEQQVGEEKLALEPANLCDILVDAVGVARPYAEQAAIRVELECQEDLCIPASPLLLAQAVVNLVRNAIAHTEPGGRVLVRGSAADASASVEVRDWGSGIAREHLPRIFERFYRVDPGRSRNRGGSGLGLAIVKHIARAHGGTVGVESEPGRGSTFTITIPVGP